jgi:hypothetical protein
MQKTFILWCLVMFGATAVFSQNGYQPTYPLEIGIQIGTTQFLGDLGGVGGFQNTTNQSTGVQTPQTGVGQGFIVDTDFASVRPTFGLFARYNIGGHFAARVDLNYLQLHGNDQEAGLGGFSAIGSRDGVSAAWYRYYRNLNFRTHVFDASIAAEIIPYNFELGGGSKNYSFLSPYGFIGIGIFAFNPEALYQGNWIELKPLRTEGQGIVDGRPEYDLVQLNIPMGFGVKWSYNDTWALALEINHRMTFTDYIDDVSFDYVDDESIFDLNMDPSTAALAKSLARRSGEIDPLGVNSEVTAPGVQRGDPGDNDAYYTVTVRFSFYIDTDNLGGGRRYGCPVW